MLQRIEWQRFPITPSFPRQGQKFALGENFGWLLEPHPPNDVVDRSEEEFEEELENTDEKEDATESVEHSTSLRIDSSHFDHQISLSSKAWENGGTVVAIRREPLSTVNRTPLYSQQKR